MKEAEHQESSLKAFGHKFAEIHRFLDSYYPRFLGSHRAILHHKLGIDLLVKRFGEKARGPAELHILEDLGSIPGDWREFDLDWHVRQDVIAELRRLYPDYQYKFL